MDRPVSIPRYIKLSVAAPLDKGTARSWLACVRANAPSGTVATVQIVDPGGASRAVAMVHRESEDRHAYLIPLTRDLSDEETRVIVEAFATEHPDLDFDVETNETVLVPRDRQAIQLDADRHLALCMALAKQRHEDWVRERTDAGWRYGPTFSLRDRTHPLLRPWDQIPDRYRAPDLTWPQKLVDLLNDQGYAILSKEDLERLIGALRGAV